MRKFPLIFSPYVSDINSTVDLLGLKCAGGLNAMLKAKHLLSGGLECMTHPIVQRGELCKQFRRIS